MARVELNIVALGDFKSVNSQIAALKAQVDLLNKSLMGTGVSQQLTKDLNSANAAFKAAMLSTGEFTASTVKLQAETDKFGQALVNGKLKLTEYFSIIRNQSSAASAQMRALALEQTKLQNSIVMADPTKKGVFSVFTPTKINEVANATKIATNMQNLYNIAVQKGTQSLINWGKNTQWAGRQLTVGLTVPMAIFGNTAMKTFKDVNDELVRMQKVYGSGLTQPTAEALATIKSQTVALAKELASTMGIAVKDTAAMAADLAATGLQGNALLNATRESLRLAKLGEMDTQSAMKATISLQNVYKLSTQDLSGAVNFLNAVENQTSTSLQDLVDGIPRVGPIVQQLGGSFKDTAIMMVAMKEAGVPAAQSANAIKSALASLINPTVAAKKAFADYNINLESIATTTKGNPIKMIMMLQSALKGLQPLAQAQLIEKLFGKFQEARIQGLIANLGSATSQTKAAFDLMGASDSALSALASKEMKTATESTTGKFQRAIETIKADLIPIGEKVMQIATVLLKFGDSVASVFSNLPTPVKSIMGILAGGVALAGPLIMFTGVLGNFVGYILRGVFGLKSLITGSKTLGELLTPNLIASQQAGQLLSTEMLKDANSVNLLNQAIRELTVTIEGMASAMNAMNSVNVASSVASKLLLPGQPGFPKKFHTGKASGDEIPAILQKGEAVIPKETINKIRTGNPLATMQALNLMNPGGGNAFQSGTGGTLLPSFTISTPAGAGTGSFNTRLTSGTASGSEWADWAKSSGRDLESHTGLMALMRSAGIDEAKAQSVGAKVHAAFTERIKMYAGNLSDSIMSREAFSTYDQVINQEFANNPQFLQQYENEKRMVGGVRTDPMRRANGKFSGGSLRNIFSPGRMIPFFANLRGEGRAESHIFPPEFVNTMQTPQAIAAGISVEKNTEEAYKKRAKIKSPSQEMAKVGKQMDQGLAQGMIQNQGLVVAAAEETTAEALIASEKTAQGKGRLASRLKGMSSGKMMIGGSLAMMGGSMALNALPNFAGKDMITSAMSMGSMGMMFGPWGAAAGAALGLVTSGISTLIAKEKEHQAMVTASFKASSDAISMFGGTLRDQSIHIHTFAKEVVFTSEELKKLQDNVDAIGKLNDKSGLKLVAESIKGMDKSSSIIGTLRSFAASQVSAGMDPKGVKDMIAAILEYAGKTKYLSAALKEIIPSTKDLKTATETYIKKLSEASSGTAILTQNYGDLSVNQKNYADGLYSTLSTVMDQNTSWSDAITISNSLAKSVKNTAEAYTLLIAAAKESEGIGSETAARLTQYNNAGLNLNAAQFLLKYGQNNVIPKNATKEELLAIATDKTKIANLIKAADLEKIRLWNASQTVYAQQAIAVSLQDQLKAAEKKLKIEQESQRIAKAIHDFAVTKTDLEGQMRVAQSQGDYLKVQSLQQQLRAKTYEFQDTTTKSPAQSLVDALQLKLDKQNTSISNSESYLKTLSTANPKPTPLTKETIADLAIAIAEANGASTPSTLVNPSVQADPSKIAGKTTYNSKTGKNEYFDSAGKSITEGEYYSMPFGAPKGEKSYVIPDEKLKNKKFADYTSASLAFLKLYPSGTFVQGNMSYRGNGQVYSGGKAIGAWYAALPGDTGQLKSYATGGHIRGAGTATSDSIPAYLSNGEYVVKADAVSHYGTGFFDSVNAKKFANGGQVNKQSFWSKLLFGSNKPIIMKNPNTGKMEQVPVLKNEMSYGPGSIGGLIAKLSEATSLAYKPVNLLNQYKNYFKAKNLVKQGMYHGDSAMSMSGTSVLDGSYARDAHYGMGFFSTSSKNEAERYAQGFNTGMDAYGPTHQVANIPFGKYIDFTKSIKSQNYDLWRMLGGKNYNYAGPELGKMMNNAGLTGSIMPNIRSGRNTPSALWLALNKPAGTILKELGSFANGGMINTPKYSMPSFAVGTPNVPYDMIAKIHKGEAIIPANMNNGTMGGTFNITINAQNANAKEVAMEVQRILNQRVGMNGSLSKVGVK
jgi:TP901 family phage tail tape measure protein